MRAWVKQVDLDQGRGSDDDITYLWTWEGWAYLATVIDLASRRVVGWAIADHLEASLVCDALHMAIAARRPAPGWILGSDRGSHYASTEFRAYAMSRYGARPPCGDGPTRGWNLSYARLAAARRGA